MKKLLAILVLFAILTMSSCSLLEYVKDLDVFQKDDGHTDHTFEYQGNPYTHQKIYTCGCPTPDIAEMHVDKNGDRVCELCGELMIEACGFRWSKTLDGHRKFPDCSCHKYPKAYEAHVDMDGDSFCDECEFELREYLLKDRIGLEWFNEIEEGDISAIRIRTGYAGVAPGRLNTIKIFTSGADISEILSAYRDIDTRQIDLEDALVAGGSTLSIQFVLKDGSVKKISLNNGIYIYDYENIFRAYNLPKITDEMNCEIHYSFVTGSNLGVAYKYDDDGSSEIFGGVKLSKLEFSKVTFDVAEDFEPNNVVIRADFGDLKFMTPYVFSYDGAFYKLEGSDVHGYIDDESVSLLIESYKDARGEGTIARVEEYCGNYRGAIVGMIADENIEYSDEEWTEYIKPFSIKYGNSNRLTVLYDGRFYTLTEAYEMGLLTEEELRQTVVAHNNNLWMNKRDVK